MRESVREKPMPTLHVVGDSISQHYGPYLQQYLGGLLAYSRKEGMPGDPNEPSGDNGGDSALVLRYLRACREHGMHWDYLLLNCGLHDIKTDPATGAKQAPPAAYAHNLGAIVPLALALASQVIWVRTTPVDDAIHNARQQQFHRFAADVDRYNAIADAIMHEHGIPAIDLFTFTRTLSDDLYMDHVHYRDGVRQLQGAFIAGYLASRCARHL